jgi:hypothetical protein
LPAPAFVENLHRLAPRLALTGIDFAQVEHLPLGDPAIAQTPVLHDIPVFVDLAILLSTVAAQEPAQSLETHPAQAKDQGLHYSHFHPPPPRPISHLCRRNRRNQGKTGVS